MSMPAEATSGPTADNVVLKKVASLTLNKADLETKVIKPRFVPEKLDFQLYEKFEGKIFVSRNPYGRHNCFLVNLQIDRFYLFVFGRDSFL